MTIAADMSRVFDEFEWLLDGCTPVHEAARRVGFDKAQSLVRAYHRAHRTPPRQLALEAECEKQRRAVVA